MALLSTAATPNNPETLNSRIADQSEIMTTRNPWGLNHCVSCKDSAELDLNSIVYLEEEDPFDIGFDTADYLPEGFDPYEAYINLDDIVFMEDEEDIELGFNTSEWLPEGFDPYAAPSDFNSISYIEEEEDVFSTLDTAAWLPGGFDPYQSDSGKVEACSVHNPLSAL